MASLTSATPPDLQAALGDRYQIERELGRGGMATVYLAQDRRHNRPVALKVLRAELSGVLGAARFGREITIAARLSHPHILPIFDSGTLALGDGTPVLYFAMPYVQGRSLRDRLEAEPQLPLDEAVRIARQVAEALEHAHRQGVVHRDIKPENILLGADDTALVADFGIARAVDAAGGERLTETGLALGTPAYMSPEQGTGSGRLDGRSDIYALGCVLYEMLAGQPPFTGPTAQAVLARHAVDLAPSIRTVRSTVGPGLARVVMRSLAKVPSDRFATAGAFAEALAVPEPSWTQMAVTAITPARVGGRRARLATLAVGIVGLAVGGVWLASRSQAAAPVAVDPAVVAIAPFRVSSADSSLRYLRDGMVDLLAGKLGGTVALRTADPRAMASAWRRAADAGGDLSEASALAIAGGFGAGRLVEGEVVGSGRRVTLSAALVEVPGGRVSARASVEGSVDSLTVLVDQMAARLLALRAGEPEHRLSALAATPLPALRAYIDGRVLLKRSDIARSVKRFENALTADSSFALAALGLVRATAEGNVENIGPAAQVAWRLRDRLSPQDRAQLEVVLGSKYPEPSPPGEGLQAAERFTQLAPDNPEAWFNYGARLMGYGPLHGVTDAWERAKAAFARSVALDSSSTLALMNLGETAASLADTATLRRAIRLVIRMDSTSPASVALQWHAALVLGDTVEARRLVLSDSMVSTRADSWQSTGPWSVSRTFLQEGLGLRDLDLVFQRSLAIAPTDDQRWSIGALRYSVSLMRGRSTGLPLPSRFGGGFADATRVMDALFADGDPAPAVAAGAALERDIGRPLGGNCCFERFAAAEYALAGGRVAAARRARADIAGVRATGEAAARIKAMVGGYGLILEAQIAARTSSSEAARRLAALDSLLLVVPDEAEHVWVYGNLIAARLHEERKEYGPALAAIRRREWTRAGAAPYVLYHRAEGRIAAEAGDTAGAILAYERYLRIRAEAEPRLQAEVAQVRRELAALGRVGGS